MQSARTPLAALRSYSRPRPSVRRSRGGRRPRKSLRGRTRTMTRVSARRGHARPTGRPTDRPGERRLWRGRAIPLDERDGVSLNGPDDAVCLSSLSVAAIWCLTVGRNGERDNGNVTRDVSSLKLSGVVPCTCCQGILNIYRDPCCSNNITAHKLVKAHSFIFSGKSSNL